MDELEVDDFGGEYAKNNDHHATEEEEGKAYGDCYSECFNLIDQ